MRNGFDDWADDLLNEGLERGIKAFIDDKLEDGAQVEVIRERIIRRFQLSEELADQYIRKYIPVNA